MSRSLTSLGVLCQLLSGSCCFDFGFDVHDDAVEFVEQVDQCDSRCSVHYNICDCCDDAAKLGFHVGGRDPEGDGK